MRTLGQLLVCVLLAVPSVHAAAVPWDLDRSDFETAASIVRAVERRVVFQTNRLAVYLEVPSAQLRAMAELPILRELALSLGLQEIGYLFASIPASNRTHGCRLER